jgi:hypothetical protein
MKKFIITSILSLVAVFAIGQVADSTVINTLTGFGVSSTVAWLIVTALGLGVGHLVVANKWASILVYLEKILLGLYNVLHWFNSKTNRVSKRQKAQKAAMIAVLVLAGSGFAIAQEPGTFFGPLDEAVQVQKDRSATGETTGNTGTFLFRPAVYATAVFIDFGQKQPETRAMSAVGMGVSWGKYTLKEDGTAYCNIGVQGSFWTGINFGEDAQTKLGVSVVGEFLNRFFSIGPAMYFDAGKPKFGLMANVSYRF